MKEKNKKEMQKKVTASASDIIANLTKNCEGLLKSNLGSKKTSIYNTGVLPSDEKGKKSTRKKLRNVLFSICSSIIEEKNEDNKKRLVNSFNEFYKATYRVNDYTLASVCNENLNATKKDVILKALQICKK